MIIYQVYLLEHRTSNSHKIYEAVKDEMSSVIPLSFCR